jgi:exodeoxyribonuclease VII large subunit
LFDNDGVHVYAVREIATYLRELLDSSPALGDVWVAGECSNVSRPSSGHVYFTLKDPNAQLRAVFFSQRFNVRARTANLVENGHALLAHGRISLYEPRGDLQLIVDFVQPEGAGALQAEFDRLKSKLAEEGLFEPDRKRPLPAMPRRIGVVTSPSGAVFHDICQVLRRRWPLAAVVLAPTPVQGSDAVPGIIGGMEAMNDVGDIDVMIIARGGGSIEELWAFNDEAVARAIFASGVPVVSAIGHETDYTIADYVADARAPTPSAAAEIVAPDRLDMQIRLGVAAGTMDSAVRGLLRAADTGIRDSRHMLEGRAPSVTAPRQRVDELTRRGLDTARLVQSEAVHGVGNCVWRLKSLDPYATLERGYAIVQHNGAVVSSIRTVGPGKPIDIRVRDGSFAAVSGSGRPVARGRRRRREVAEAQAPLFTMPEDRV